MDDLKLAGNLNDRSGKAPDYDKDDLPAHRKVAGDYFLRIGDCQFAVPPEFIQVQRVSTVNSGGFMRQTQSFKHKNGQSETRIELQLWFTNLEEINGYKVNSPVSGQKFYMDGLRPLIAQFKKQPFLPVVNEYLNDVLDIHAVAFSNLSFTTVEGFPNMIQANVTLYKMEVDMYIGKPSWTYDQHFMYPLFRWYYNQMLVTNKPSYSTTYLEPVESANYTRDIKLGLLDESFLQANKSALNKLKDVELDGIAYNEIKLPKELICTGIFGSMGTIFAPLTMDMRENATFQYMGGADTNFMLTFETTSRDAVAQLERIFSTLERYSRQYRDRFVSGYMQITNSIVNMAGVKNVMIQDMTVATVPGYPDLFQIQMSLVSYKDTQYKDQRLQGVEEDKGGFNIVSTSDASEIMKTGMGAVAEKYLHEKNEPWYLTEEGVATGMLDQLELYPDLELPNYGVLNRVVKEMNSYRKDKGYEQLPITSYKTPRHLYRHFGKDDYETVYLPDSVYVDPDFYFTYPDWDKIEMVDTDMFESGEMTFNVSTGEILGGSADYSQKPGMPTYSSYSGSASGPHHGQKANRLKGTDKYNSLIQSVATSKGVNPVFVKVIMAIETEGTVPKSANAYNCWGLMQVQKNSSNSSKYDWNAFTKTDEASVKKQIAAGCDIILEKLSTLKSLRSKHPGSRWTNNPEVQMVANLYYGDDANGASYGEWALQLYRGLGYGKTDPVAGDATGGNRTGSVSLDADIFVNAEADVLLSIPKTKKEEADQQIENSQISPNTVVKGMLHDMQKYSRRGNMVRAFPTYVLAIVDEGVWVDYRRLWNNYYTYHAVEEISLVKERGNPVSTAYLKLQNTYGALNKTNYDLVKEANAASQLPGWTEMGKDLVTGKFKELQSGASKWFRTWFPVVNDQMVQQRMRHIEKSAFYLRTGARVHIRMGYGSVASMMPVTFNGRITEIDVGDIAEVICQSDGLELIEPYTEWAADSRKTWWNLKKEPKDIIDDMLVNREGWDELANYPNPFTRTQGAFSKYGIEHFGYVIGKDQSGFWNGWFTDFFKNMAGLETVNGYDARKNVYNSNGTGNAGNDIWDGETNVGYWETNKSPWDVMQLLTTIIPDYELKVHEHNFHSTLFYGQPQWYVKYGYFQLGKDSTKPSNYREVVKPSQQFHHLDSMFDIITNRVKASDKNICTVAVPVFSFDEKPKAGYTLYADPNIKPEMQKTEIVDTSLLQDYPMGDVIAEVARWVGNTLMEGVQGAIDLIDVIIPGDLDANVADFIDKNSKTERLASEAAKTHIQWKFREMYQGDLVIIGDSAINPGDLFSLADTYTQMVGNAEVGRVVHVMGMGSGFVTTIKPDLIAARKDGKRAEMLSLAAKAGIYLGARSVAFAARRYVFKKPSAATTALKNTVSWMKTIKKARTAGMAISSVAGPPGWIAALAQLALWTAIDVIADALMNAFTKHRANVQIMPLWYKNRPYVAGIDGHKELIPGYWDENFYGEYEDGAWDASTGTAEGTGAGGMVPEGYTVTRPTKNHRETAPFNEKRTRSDGSVYYHKGTDFGAIKAGVDGDDIYCTANGTIEKVGWDADGYGHYLIVKHDMSDNPVDWDGLNKIYNFYSLYGHLSKINVSKGQKVSCGEVIGQMGNTGVSFGTHLHFELRADPSWFKHALKDFFSMTPIDPQKFLKAAKAYKW